MPLDPPTADWRAQLEVLGITAGGASGPPARDDASPGARPAMGFRALALQFELRRRRARRDGDWQGPRDEPAKRADGVDRLAVRPVAAGARNGWAKAGLTWQNIAFQGASQGYDPEQARWFAHLALLKGRSPSVYTTYGSEWITLDEYESPLLWAHLADAARLGVALVGSPATRTVRLATSATVGLDARYDRPDASGEPRARADLPTHAGTADLVLTPNVELDGRVMPAAAARAIGDHGLYAFDFAAGELTLAPVPGGLSPAQRAVLDQPRDIRVVPGEAVEFLRSAYPRLAEALPITSHDDSFEPPPPMPATLVLHARFEPDEVLHLAWHWEHADGRRELIADDPVLDAAAGASGSDAADPDLDPEVIEPARDELGGLPMAPITLRGADVAWFADRVIRRLRRLDRVRVDVTGDPPDYREAGVPQLTVTTVESPKTDWFDLGVVVTVNGRKVAFMPLFRALAKGQRRLLLVDKTYLDLTQPLFEPLRDLLDEAGTLDEWETGVRIHRSQVALWAEFEDLADQAEPAVSWRETVSGLTGRDGADTPPPPGLEVELRPYQLDGFRWLALLWRSRLGGILADDMGLGKTVQTLALIAHARRADASPHPFLVVAPSSVASNWLAEAARFTPGLRVAAVLATDTADRGRLAAAAATADVVVTTYAVLRLDAARFAARDWAGLVLDEAQFVKNPATKVHDAARAIRAPFRLALTGTPIENHTGELWAILRIVAPGLFPSRRAFDEQYRRPIEAGHRERLERLRRRIRPLMLRRTKEQVAPELPPKQEQILTVELAPRHRRLYDATLQRERTKLLGLVDDLDRQRHIVYRSLTLLRMLALDASLIDEAHTGLASAKLDALFEQLDDVLAEGHRALVFSQFTSFLGKAAERLTAEGVPFAWLDGSTPLARRDAEIARFRSGEASVFCISLKAGGFGLNLTEADYVFLLDPWWNPASEDQAVDRAHRIGQAKQVMVYRLVAANTIEEKVMTLKRRKGELVAAVLEGDAGQPDQRSALTADDLRELLADE
ncbi:DEAD/DEAH box helicase [Agromyces aerolatus]|uniref:DEAD/DEAH box helicase n=1 Tax=Agromyces sp. LY-1074 TaxID=3074080 RepID=UPI0028635612|nr:MULTISPECIES: DEAD/DEAH box helicase [unclassified Agromyces]MDR5698538.1 DEAD/DEAH box helicase [Agromyces sp. LY-1074]MDR5704832.1 DEAD/DEAH box helicase [Agromyces sp. LY-1358]